MYPNNFLKLFACCIPVKGYKRSVICDLQRNIYDLIPNTLYDMLKEYEGCTLEEIKTHYEESEHETIEEYVDFLLEKEYIFFTDNVDFFPKLNLDWESPYQITNSIVDIAEFSNHNYSSIFQQLSHLKCQCVELRFFNKQTVDSIKKILLETKNTSFRSINLLIKYSEELNISDIEGLYDLGVVLNSVLIHSCTKLFSLSRQLPVFQTEKSINDESHCGIINAFNFNINVTLFTESVNFNNCLNRKISIDKNGLIKNCPSSSKHYGKANETTLISALNNAEFKELWGIKKDLIDDCKDCEFRYICVDCRLYRKDEKNKYSKPEKCNYNPYLAEYSTV